MLDILPLFLSFPVFQGVIIEELFPIGVVLVPADESFLIESPWALTLNVHTGVIAKIINIAAKDITKTNLLFIVYLFEEYLL
jgi:hypothetical protein